jgi:hypothetical protein
MRVTVFGFSLFVLAFVIHLIVWRVRLPVRQTLWLLVIFLGALLAGLAAGLSVSLLRPYAPATFFECLHVVLFHVPLTLAYVAGYSLLEDDSPSVAIVKYVAAAGHRGRAREEFRNIIRHESLVKLRLEAMVRDRLIVQDLACYRLTAKGTLLVRVFMAAQNVLGLPTGG